MTSQCQHCGAQVTEQYARVFGDQENVVHRCPSCDCKNRIQKGSAAGKDVSQPDPAEYPNRNRGHLVDSKSVDTGKGPVPDGGHKVVPVTKKMQDALVTHSARVVLSEDTTFFNPLDDWLLIRGPDGIFAKARFGAQIDTTAEQVRTRRLDQKIDSIAKQQSIALEEPLPEIDSFETLQEYVPIESRYESFSCYVLKGIGPAPEEIANKPVATDGGSGGGSRE